MKKEGLATLLAARTRHARQTQRLGSGTMHTRGPGSIPPIDFGLGTSRSVCDGFERMLRARPPM